MEARGDHPRSRLILSYQSGARSRLTFIVDIGMLLFVRIRKARTRGNDDHKRRAGLGF